MRNPEREAEIDESVAPGGSGKLILVGVLACFLLSGFAALLYQTAWLRQFSIIFGTSEIAVATVLSAYMAGLAIGAAIAGHYLRVITRPILTYGLLEAGIAITALAVPWLLDLASAVYVYFMGGQPEPSGSAGMGQTVFYLAVAFVVLALPTGFMGATLPLLTRHAVRSDRETGSRVALLYATNTAGAVLGTVVAGFILLPQLGLASTVWVGVAINAVVFLIASQLARHLLPLPVGEPGNAEKLRQLATGFAGNCIKPLLQFATPLSARLQQVFQTQPAWILPVMAFSGANAFIYEVLWTRLLNHVLGGSIYAFATMLASFLTGIALGGGIAGQFAGNRQSATIGFTVSQVMIAVLSVAVYAWIEQIVPETRTLQENAVFAALVMLPSTIFIGATFPLAVRILSRSEADAGASTANVYAWNTLGAIVGAILAGFYLIPGLGFEGTIKLAVLINLLLALVTLSLIANKQRMAAVATGIGLLLGLVFYSPLRPDTVIRASAIDVTEYTKAKEIFFAVGRSSTVLMMDHGGSYTLRTNGLPEASVYAKGSPPIRHSQRWLTALPVAARPDADSVLIIGYGGGVAVEGVPPSVSEIDIIELEPEVINASRRLSEVRSVDPLTDPRVHIILNDARNALKLTDKRYDIIVSQPSHPWTAGASHLFTEEFISIGNNHLTDDGVFVQWMNSEFTNEELLKQLTATLLAVFDHVRLYHIEPGVLFFLASRSPIEIEKQIARTGRPITDNLAHYSLLGINSVEDVLLTLAADEAGLKQFSQYAKSSTDDDNKMATHSNLYGTGLTGNQLQEILAPYDPLLKRDSWIHTELGIIDYTYLASRMMFLGFSSRANKLAAVVPDKATELVMNAIGLAYFGKGEEARKYYQAAFLENPLDQSIRYLLVRPNLSRLALGLAPDEIVMAARGLDGTPAAVVAGWKLAGEKNWPALSRLESQLNRGETTDPWYTDAAQLRSEWRTKVRVAEGENRYAYDSLRILDRALMVSPSLDLYVLRAASAILLNHPDAIVESSRYVGTFIEGTIKRVKSNDYNISSQELEVMKGRLNALIEQMENPVLENTSGRNVEVRGFLKSILDEVNTITVNASDD